MPLTDAEPVRCSQCGNDMNVEPHAEDCKAAAYIAVMSAGYNGGLDLLNEWRDV